MLRLFFHFNGDIFKARLAFPDEKFTRPLVWKNQIEFELTDSTMFMMAWTSLIPDLREADALSLVSLVSARYPVSDEYQDLAKLCPTIVVGQDSDEWVFFGGSFFPWHAGHQACLKLLPDALTCFVMPDRNPLKEVRSLDPALTIIELSSRIRFKKNQFLVPTFLLDQKKNPTVEWVEKLRKNFPEKKISLLLGFDSFITIKDWIKGPDLLRELHALYVVSRLEDDAAQEKAAILVKSFAPQLEVQFLGRHEFERLSSTDLRK